MFVLGTAGHIDHGKSVLVRALTGIDPDRLREEKERGMTIDLGFAWLKLPGGEEVGIVDVPGHERFIKNMLAGVGGIDLALLIVAANEGVMPQTREHLAIIDLLGIERGIVVLTKKDLVDEEFIELVRLDVEELIASSTISGAPIVPVSAVTGEGLPDLISAIDELLKSTESRKDIGRPRLAIDRIFTIAGSGTVVTGTLIDSNLSLGQEVEILPPGLKSRIRGLQTHKSRLETVTPGSRVAINLVGVATSQLKRGDVLTTPGWLRPTNMISTRFRLLSQLQRPLSHNVTVSFHTGAAETMAKIRLLEGDKLEPGETTWIQLALSEPVAVVKNDRFIVRSPMETLGGGVIVEPQTKRLRRFRPAVILDLEVKEKGSSEEVVLTLLEPGQPMELSILLTKADLPTGEVAEAVESLVSQKRIIDVGSEDQKLLFTLSGWENMVKQITSILQDYHRRFPTRLGMPKAELGSRLKLGRFSPEIWQRLSGEGVLREEGLTVCLSTFQVKLTQAQQGSIDAFLKAMDQNPYSPPADLIPEPDLLNLLIEQQKVVKISNTVVFATPVYEEMIKKVVEQIKSNGKITLAEVRDMFKTSRKYIQALLEHMDEKKITRRIGDERVLY